MRKILVTTLLLAALIAGAVYAWKAEHPIAVLPAEDWPETIASPDFTPKTFFVPVDGATLEAMILLPNDADGPVGAVVFAGGSGDGLFQNYAHGFLETYLQDIFLPRGLAVVYVNKRGMGASTGNWMNNTIEGRASDVVAVANAVRAMPEVDPARVGYAGHSQGGWVVVRAGAEDPTAAFILNFMGPLRSPDAQFDNLWHNVYRCEGRSEDNVEAAYARKAWITRVAMKVGRVLPIGMLEFDSKFFNYQSAGILARVSAPVLSVFGGGDLLVDGPANQSFLVSEFPQGVPSHIEAVSFDGLNHTGFRTDNPCGDLFGPTATEASPELVSTIEGWLERNGF